MATTSTRSEARTKKELMATLAELGGKLVSDDDLLFQGSKLVIPTTMSIKSAMNFLARKLEDEETVTSFIKRYHFRPNDGARAVSRVFNNLFGTFVGIEKMTMFGPRPPQMIDIDTGPDTQEQVPWGLIGCPLMPEAEINLGSWSDDEFGTLFGISVSAPKKYKHQIEGMFKLVQVELETNSIYRGKAIDGQQSTQFLDLKGVDPSKVVYSDEIMTQLNANIWSLLDHSQAIRNLGMPLKRAALLYGPYGTGKTLAAFLTAKKAVENGWTFIYVRPGRDDLMASMQTARLYQPSVVFFEDVDTISRGDSSAVTELLDIFDGITAKGTEIVAILTTNHAERIHKGMVRPGRLDACIEIGALDKSGITRMIEACIPSDKREPDLDFDAIYESMVGFLPAFCKEAIERTMRYAIARTGTVGLLTTSDFIEAASGLRPQLDLMNADRVESAVTMESLMAGVVGKSVDLKIQSAYLRDHLQEENFSLAIDSRKERKLAQRNGQSG